MGPKKVSGMSLLRGSCYSSIKHHLLGQNTKEIKEDLIIFKLNISLTFTKPSFHGRNPRKTFKNRSVYILLTGNQNRSLHNSFDAKIVLNWRLQILSPIRCTVVLGISTSSQLKGFFLLSETKGLLQHTDVVEVSALARLTFYENLLIGKETSVRCTH